MEPKPASTPVDRAVAALAGGQHGVVGHRQLLDIGLTREAVKSRIRRGLLHPVHRGVYLVGHRSRTTAAIRVAALLACGDNAVLSHRSAADAWGLRASNPRMVDVTIAPKSGRKGRRGVRLHRHVLLPGEVTTKDGLPVTTVARTIFDIADELTPRALERLIDEAEHLRVLDLAAIDAVIQAHPQRAGRPKLVALMQTHRPGSTRTRSPLEERFLRFCRKHKLPRPEVNVPIGPYFADFLWRDRRLIVETDGRDAHARTRAFEADRERDAFLMVRGFRVVRYTDRRLKSAEAQVAAEVRALLEA